MNIPSKSDLFAIQTTGIIVCVVGVLLAPILIGIPFIVVGLFAFFAPRLTHRLLHKEESGPRSRHRDIARDGCPPSRSHAYADQSQASVPNLPMQEAPSFAWDALSDCEVAKRIKTVLDKYSHLPPEEGAPLAVREMKASPEKMRKAQEILAKYPEAVNNDHLSDKELLYKLRDEAAKWVPIKGWSEQTLQYCVNKAGISSDRGIQLLAFVNRHQDLYDELMGPIIRQAENGSTDISISEQDECVGTVPESDVSDEDEILIDKCLEIIKSDRRASASLFQRRLRLGSTRAARIMDILEERGIVGPTDGAKDRKLLLPEIIISGQPIVNIYVSKYGERYGPLTLEQIKNEIAKLTISLEDFAWYESLNDWIPVRQLFSQQSHRRNKTKAAQAMKRGGRGKHQRRV